MHYAATGRIASKPFDGCIEITRAQYKAALAGMQSGMVVTVFDEDGFNVGPVPQTYAFSDDTGEYLGPGPAAEIVANAWTAQPGHTLSAPPNVAAKHVAVFAEGEWTEVVDRRGETWWQGHGEPVVIDTLGDPAERGLYAEEPEAVPPTEVDLLAHAAQVRFERETRGITIAGAAIPTDRDSQAMIAGAYAYAQANPAQSIDFKASSGWVSLSAAQMVAIGEAVGSHVQQCFAAEKVVDDDIGNGTITTIAAIDEDPRWP